MPAKDLGNKFTCFKCGTRFYDLRKPEPLCPKCGADQRESPALKPAPERRTRARPVEPKPAEVEVDSELEEDAELDEDDEKDEAADDEA